LFGVARRLLAEHHRLRPDVAALVDADGLVDERDPTAPVQNTSPDRGPAVRAALRSLVPVDRELVTLTVWDGLTPAEAAAVVGLTAGTARVRLHRARARLARHPQLRDLLGSPDPDEPRLAAAAVQPT
jgi:RNA polymerase sigma-70 factor (ECF subfamily)